MLVKIIPATGEIELEQQINQFILGKHILDIKLTEWVSYQNQTGGYTAFIQYEPRIPEIQVQVRIMAVNGDLQLESEINNFIKGRAVQEIKFTEWVEYTAQTGGYTALIIYTDEYQPTKQTSNQPSGQQPRYEPDNVDYDQPKSKEKSKKQKIKTL